MLLLIIAFPSMFLLVSDAFLWSPSISALLGSCFPSSQPVRAGRLSFLLFFFFSSPLFKRILGITRSFKLLWSLLFQALFLVPVPHIIFPWALLAAVIAVTSQYCSADHSHHSSQARVLWDILTSQDVQN